MTTAVLIKLIVPLTLLAALGALAAFYPREPRPQQFNTRQQQMIDSLRTARVKEK